LVCPALADLIPAWKKIMRVTIGDAPADASSMWYPSMNFGQFRWPGVVGKYELMIPSDVFVGGLADAYEQCIHELQIDDEFDLGEAGPLRLAGYPTLIAVLKDETALLDVLANFLWHEFLASFIPISPQDAKFMINSIDHAKSREPYVLIQGRGYHGAPGFAS
jgi:hypothetical protein